MIIYGRSIEMTVTQWEVAIYTKIDEHMALAQSPCSTKIKCQWPKANWQFWFFTKSDAPPKKKEKKEEEKNTEPKRQNQITKLV